MEGILGITLLADEWKSSKGGLSTLNRELAKQLAQQPHVSVTILVPEYSEQEKQAANDNEVNLATPIMIPGFDPIVTLSFPHEEHATDIVVGHGQKLGPPAYAIAVTRQNCRRFHVVHTASEELAMFKKRPQAISQGERKHEIEVKLSKTANIVIAIGPKLTEAIKASLRPYSKDKDVINFTPGIFPEFSRLEQASEERGKFRVLVFGRGDPEDFELKGYDIAAQAVAGLNDASYHLIFVGAPDGNEEEVKDNLLKCGIKDRQLTVRGFIESREKLGNLFLEADLAIMPSRTEGFGLTALEALSAGLPILVSDNSGFGQALLEINHGSTFVVYSDDVEEWGQAIKRARQKLRDVRLGEARSLRSSYAEKYKWETQCAELVEKMPSLK